MIAMVGWQGYGKIDTRMEKEVKGEVSKL